MAEEKIVLYISSLDMVVTGMMHLMNPYASTKQKARAQFLIERGERMHRQELRRERVLRRYDAWRRFQPVVNRIVMLEYKWLQQWLTPFGLLRYALMSDKRWRANLTAYMIGQKVAAIEDGFVVNCDHLRFELLESESLTVVFERYRVVLIRRCDRIVISSIKYC